MPDKTLLDLIEAAVRASHEVFVEQCETDEWDEAAFNDSLFYDEHIAAFVALRNNAAALLAVVRAAEGAEPLLQIMAEESGSSDVQAAADALRAALAPFREPQPKPAPKPV